MKTKFNCDQLNDQDVFGWGSVERLPSGPATAEDDLTVVLKAGGTVIGQQRRVIPRPDADKAAGQPGVNKGFRMPALAPYAVLLASAPGEPLPLTLSFAGADIVLSKQPGRLLDMGQFRSLKLCEPGAPITIADLWFASEHELRFRIENVRGAHGLTPPWTVRFFQPEFAPGLRLVQIGETTVRSDGMGFMSQFLRNPLLPVLITVCDANGDTAAMDAVPFPSLCRGGFHHAELQALASGAGYVSDLRMTGDTLLREIWDAPQGAKSRHLSHVVIDGRQATGAERIFSANVLQWLMLAQGLTIEMQITDGGKSPVLAEGDGLLGTALANSGLSGHATKSLRPSALRLTMPADGLPTLAAVMSRRLEHDGGRHASVTTFLTANAATGEPRWYVGLPPVAGDLAGLQPEHLPAPYPVIGGAKAGKSTSALLDAATPLAMAIRFLDDAFKADEARILPVAPDVERIAGAPPDHADGPLVSVVVSVRNGGPMVQDLIASLASQTLAQTMELVIVNNRSNSSTRALLEQAAAERFKERFVIVDYDAPFNHSAQTNAGVAASRGAFVCIVDSDVILYDPRTLATLVSIAAKESVAVAGCMMLESRPGKSDGVKFRSAGIFPAAVVFGGPPRLSFAEPDCGAAFGPATYPVAAVGFALACIRRSVWDAVGSLDAERVATDCNDIDFCLRALAAGYINACCSAVAAFHAGHATRGQNFDVLASSRLPVMALPPLLAKCTVLRRLG